MPYQQIRVASVAGALGAEVSGVDLAGIDDATAKEIHDAWMEHQVLFFRDQPLSYVDHKTFAARFGELHVHPVLPNLGAEGHPELIVLESNEKIPFVADTWHSDVTFSKQPPMGTVLRSEIAPPAGGDTMWSSMYAAYDALSDAMQHLLSELSAAHDGGGFRYVASDDQKGELAKDEKAVHPVVRTHPVTGRKALFVNSTFTRSIVGMKPAESRALLEFLYEHVASPEFTCRLRWQRDTIAMWDNRCTQHRVVGDNRTAHRRMIRATICGDEPF